MNDTGSLFSTLSKKTAQVPTSFECFSLQGPSSAPSRYVPLRLAQHCPHRTNRGLEASRVSPPWQVLVLSPRGWWGQGFEVKRVTSPSPASTTVLETGKQWPVNSVTAWRYHGSSGRSRAWVLPFNWGWQMLHRPVPMSPSGCLEPWAMKNSEKVGLSGKGLWD